MPKQTHAHDHLHDDHGSHRHSHVHLKSTAPQAIRRAILVTVIFMIVEVVGGWVSNSLALLSDAAHMLTDVGAMLLSLFAVWVARKPTTPTMSFGYHRAEILGALVSGLLIWLIAGVLIYEAFMRMLAPPDVQGPLVFVVATIGLLANLVSMKILHSNKDENINIRAAYLHLFTDMLGSVGAIIAGLVLWLTGWRPIDPIITLVFAALMLFSSWSLVREAVSVLMESTPAHLNPSEIMKHLQALETVQEAHDLHIWTVSSGKHALSVHLISERPGEALNQANQLLQDQHQIVHTTIQVEHPEHFESKRCYDCVPVEV